MTNKRCPDCGAENSADARFCNQCAHSLVAAEQPQAAAARVHYTPKHLVERVLKHRSALLGERKQVTVLFADMAGSTRVAEQLDPELWHQILDEYFAILTDEVHRYEGTVNQYTGDGIMALFGAPLALEDHAQRAGFAALALRHRLREFADRVRLQHGLNLSTRMGLNSGEVIVGAIGDDLRMDYTAKGLTVNLAARMEQIAAPGEVYLTRYTADLIQDYFQLRTLGPMTVKGSAKAIEVFELLAPSDISLRLEASRQRGLSGFCGREQEIATLKQTQSRRADAARISLVIGDAGLGKSRLCFEAASLWRQQGLTVLSVSGVPHGQAVPLQPVKALIRQRFEITPDETASSARRKLAGGLLMQAPQLKPQLPLLFEFLGIAETDAASEMPADARAHRIRDVFRQICQLEPQQPRVIQIDDLHWLDAGSLEFLKVALECAGADSYFLLNMRPGPLPDWLQNMQPEVLQLQPLGQSAMSQIALGLLGHDKGMPALAERLTQHAAGNPFFIEEAIRALAAAGDLTGQPGQYLLQHEPEQLQIAPSVQATIAGRVDRLSADAKAALQAAAVLGQGFELELLQALNAELAQAWSQILSELQDGHYLQPDPDSASRMQFCHPILREVVYASLLNQQRESLHRRTAAILQKHLEQSACIESQLLLAQHWASVEEWVLAAQSAFDAAQQLQHENAAECVRVMWQVIDWLDPMPAQDQARMLVFQACVLVLRSATFFESEMQRLDICYARAREIADHLNNPILLAELMISNGARWLNRASADEAVANNGEAMRLAQQVAQSGGDHSLEQRFRIPILFSYFAAGRIQEGLDVLDRRDGGAWHRGEVHEDNMLSRGFRALMLAAMGDLATAEAETLQAIACVEACGRKVSWLPANLVDIQIQRGHFNPQSDLAQRAVAEAREFGSPLFEEIALRALAQTLLARGEVQDATELMLRSQHLVAADAVAAQFRSAHALVLGQAYLQAADPEAARLILQHGIQAGRESAQRMWLLRCLLQQARVHMALGLDMDEPLAEAAQLIGQTRARLYLGELYECKAERSRLQGSMAEYRALLTQAAQHWSACGAPARAAQLQDSVQH